ncbi:MAG: hypothetical protein DI535_28445 [Citrobacter freundii]|nr:MAG: hypothetical protein DI535_28445 [Citrobacter freundii]
MMNHLQRVIEIEQQLNQLSADIQASQQELLRLQQELRMLKQHSGLPVSAAEELPVMTTTPKQQHGLENFIGLKLIHLVGIIVLVIGLSIGVKYAIDGELISEMMRIILAYSAGILLFVLSFRLRKKYAFFSAILFSGSMASVYFTTYAAFAYYHFISGGIAFAIMAALTIYTTLMALQYDRKEIAVIGMIGAYGIPFLVSSNSERFELFFSYIFLINIGTVFLSFRRNWKLVGQLAMLITWTLFIGWALMRYEPQDKLIWLIFLSAFFILFMVNALSFLLFKKQSLAWTEVQQLLVNQAALYIASLCLFDAVWASGIVFVLFAAIALMAVYIFPAEKILQRSLTLEALILLLLWIFLRWDGLTVTLLWVAVSVILFAWGIIGHRAWFRLAAVFLTGITLGKLLIFDSGRFTAVQKIICYIAIGVLLLLFSFYYQRLGLSVRRSEDEVKT